MIRNVLRFVFFPFVLLRRYLREALWFQALCLYCHDYRRYVRYAGAMENFTEESSLARIIMGYHVIEKGLTMPKRRLSFGHGVVLELMSLIERHVRVYGITHPQIRHAIGVVKAYDEMHRGADCRSDEGEYWLEIERFIGNYANIPVAAQRHMTREEFFLHRESSFPAFAMSRHTLRHYEGTVDLDTIKKAVSLAQCAPSACNRQHIRVYCVADHTVRDQIYSLQNGNRGFGHLADKLLVITGDLEDVRWLAERHDVYTNGGIFLMNLCYALHYYEVAHCILNCSLRVAEDRALHEILGVPESEVFISILSCGRAPAEFDVASSPRRELSEIFVVKDGGKSEK